MTYPGSGAMYLLLALDLGETITPSGVDLRLTIPGKPEGVRVPPVAFDELEARGWIEIGDGEGSGVKSTERGRYHLDKWMRRALGPGRIRIVSARVRAAEPVAEVAS